LDAAPALASLSILSAFTEENRRVHPGDLHPSRLLERCGVNLPRRQAAVRSRSPETRLRPEKIDASLQRFSSDRLLHYHSPLFFRRRSRLSGSRWPETDRRMKPDYWDEAVRTLSGRDPVLARIIASYPADIHLTRRGDPFTTLARAIVGQQLSVKAAQTIWNRFVAKTGDADATPPIAPERVARVRLPTLRSVGLSERKAQYLRDLARHFVTGKLDPGVWPSQDDETLIASLVDVKGIGRWTAEMFLIFHELRADVFPIDDIGVQKAIALHYFNRRRPSPNRMRKLAKQWQPYRSVATWYLWRSLDPLPVEY
jgi:DNA-3-methyladenine glycosylase II